MTTLTAPPNVINVTPLGDADVPVLVQQAETVNLEAVVSGGAVANPVRQALGLVLLTTLVIFLFAFIATWWAAGDALGAAGVAAFSAFWGGPGFGVMVAGSAWHQAQA